MTVDLIYLAKGREEYTHESAKWLARNTNRLMVRDFLVFTDGTTLPPDVDQILTHAGAKFVTAPIGGPVNTMNAYLAGNPADVFAKIDNDVIVPPFWLEQCVQTMLRHPQLDILGIEPPLSRTRAPWSNKEPETPELFIRECYVGYVKCPAVGGIGLFRSQAFARHPDMRQHSTYGGFTDWQHRHADVTKGWIVPPLSLFLLDRLPFEPWQSLGRKYIGEGLQRPWTMYQESAARLWQWWLDSLAVAAFVSAARLEKQNEH